VAKRLESQRLKSQLSIPDVELLARWIETWLVGPRGGAERAALVCGMDRRLFYRLRNGKQRHLKASDMQQLFRGAAEAARAAGFGAPDVDDFAREDRFPSFVRFSTMFSADRPFQRGVAEDRFEWERPTPSMDDSPAISHFQWEGNPKLWGKEGEPKEFANLYRSTPRLSERVFVEVTSARVAKRLENAYSGELIYYGPVQPRRREMEKRDVLLHLRPLLPPLDRTFIQDLGAADLDHWSPLSRPGPVSSVLVDHGPRKLLRSYPGDHAFGAGVSWFIAWTGDPNGRYMQTIYEQAVKEDQARLRGRRRSPESESDVEPSDLRHLTDPTGKKPKLPS